MRPGNYKLCALCEHHGCDDCGLVALDTENPLKWHVLKSKGNYGDAWFLLMPDNVPPPNQIKHSDWLRKVQAIKS